MIKPPYLSFTAVKLFVFLFSVVLALNACGRSASMKRPNMNAMSLRLQPLFQTTKTVCFGRFILDVPASAIVVYGSEGLDGGDIVRYPDESASLKERIEKERDEFNEKRKDRLVDNDFVKEHPLFGQVVDGIIPGQKLIYGTRNYATTSIDSYFAIGKDLFIQKMNSAVSENETVAHLNAVASRLRARAEHEVPGEAGLCFDGSFLPGELKDLEFEGVALGVRLKEFPDVHFSVEVNKNGEWLIESSRLEPRLKSAQKDGGLHYSRIAFLRRGERQLGEWRGEEALAHMPADKNSTDAHEFLFMGLGAIKDRFLPKLDIQLNTGVKDNRTASVRPSLTDEEAVALWDKLTSSIRVRPTGSDKGAAPIAPKAPAPSASLKTPLGALGGTGDICPRTGWWDCADGGQVDRGARRHFTAGDVFPPITQLGNPTWLQRFKGERLAFTKTTVWALRDVDALETADAIAPLVAEVPPAAPLTDTAEDKDGLDGKDGKNYPQA